MYLWILTQKLGLKKATGALLGPNTYSMVMVQKWWPGWEVVPESSGSRFRTIWKPPQSFFTTTAMEAWKQNHLGQVGKQNHKDVLVLTYQSIPILEEWKKMCALERYLA